MITTDQPTIFDKKAVLAAISAKNDGNMRFSSGQPAQVIASREAWLQNVGTTAEQTVWMNVRDPQTWDMIYDATPDNFGSGMFDPATAITTDAIVTNHKNLALVLMIADCNPVIVHDPVQQAIALVHLGWQSTAANLASKVVHHLQQKYHSNPADLKIYNGPSIRAQSYTFEPPITQAGLPGWQPYLIDAGQGRVGIDLVGYNQQQFIDAGVQSDNIQISHVDTATSQHYFSHYRAAQQHADAQEGRFAALVQLITT